MSNKAQRLGKILQKEKLRGIGVMTGMSKDGFDLADVTLSGEYPSTQIDVSGHSTFEFKNQIRETLDKVSAGGLEDYAHFERIYSENCAEAVQNYLKKHAIESNDIDFISVHGQTVFHGLTPAGLGTLQLGSPSMIAELTGIPTIGHFRQRDLAVGGVGAPFAPLLDTILAGLLDKTTVLLNLGSIANITVINPHTQDLRAFDIGPANMLSDALSIQLSAGANRFDQEGKLARTGKVDNELLSALLKLPFFKKVPPKAAGYEDFGFAILRDVLDSQGKPLSIDVLRTVIELTAVTIAHGFKTWVQPEFAYVDSILVSGGGAHNSFLMEQIKHHVHPISVSPLHTHDQNWIDHKEATLMALMGYLYLKGTPNVLSQVTGANRSVIAGELAL